LGSRRAKLHQAKYVQQIAGDFAASARAMRQLQMPHTCLGHAHTRDKAADATAAETVNGHVARTHTRPLITHLRVSVLSVCGIPMHAFTIAPQLLAPKHNTNCAADLLHGQSINYMPNGSKRKMQLWSCRHGCLRNAPSMPPATGFMEAAMQCIFYMIKITRECHIRWARGRACNWRGIATMPLHVARHAVATRRLSAGEAHHMQNCKHGGAPLLQTAQ